MSHETNERGWSAGCATRKPLLLKRSKILLQVTLAGRSMSSSMRATVAYAEMSNSLFVRCANEENLRRDLSKSE